MEKVYQMMTLRRWNHKSKCTSYVHVHVSLQDSGPKNALYNSLTLFRRFLRDLEDQGLYVESRAQRGFYGALRASKSRRNRLYSV